MKLGTLATIQTIFLLLLISASVSADAPPGIFYDAMHYPGGAGPKALAVADFNGDTHLDVAVADSLGDSITVFMGNGNGGFGSGTGYTGHQEPFSIIAEDFDADEDIDLAVANFGANNVKILLNNGSGTFVSGQTITLTSSPTSLCARTLNGSINRFDLAIACDDDPGVRIYFNNGSAVFSAAGQYSIGVGNTPDGSNSVCIADVDGNEHADIIAGCQEVTNSKGVVSVLLANTDGTFQPAVNYYVAGPPQQVTVAVLDEELSGSTNLDYDIITANGFIVNATASVSILLNNGDGTFPAQSQDHLTGGIWTSSVVCADLTDDQWTDIVVVDAWDDFMTVFQNTGGGVFLPTATWDYDFGENPFNYYEPVHVMVGDFNEDNNYDIITADNSGSAISVFMNKISKDYICGDANGDHEVNVGDAVFLINYIFKGGAAPDPLLSGDANGDCLVNVGDAVYLINFVFKAGSPPQCAYCGRKLNVLKESDEDVVMPGSFTLHHNYPNPFNPTTTISFSLPVATDVNLNIYNIAGQKVATVANGFFDAGTHSVVWDANGAASGVYLYRIEAGEFKDTKKMLLMK